MRIKPVLSSPAQISVQQAGGMQEASTMMRTGFLLLATVGVLGLAGCSPPASLESPKVESPKVEKPVAAQPTQSDPAAYRGAAVAGQVCSRCHDVGMGAPPVMEIGAPKFPELAARAESTPESLATAMRDSHPVMPDYIFGDAEISDLAAYILSLRGGPG
jgi:mono/diheme cytochrome c family protein